MPQRSHPEIRQILIRQMLKHLQVDIGLFEPLGVYLQADIGQP